jgi:hypothetical protein
MCIEKFNAAILSQHLGSLGHLSHILLTAAAHHSPCQQQWIVAPRQQERVPPKGAPTQ